MSSTFNRPSTPTWVCLAATALIFSLLRLEKVPLVPLFVDEALHLQWAQEFSNGNFHGPLPDGKFLYFFLLVPALWTSSPILIARLISVLTSFAALLLLFMIGRRLFDTHTAVLAGVIYSVCSGCLPDRLSSRPPPAALVRS